MLTWRRVGPSFSGRAPVEALYEQAFPENERRDLSFLMEDRTGVSDFLVFYTRDGEDLSGGEDGVFAGFVSVLKDGDIAHIIYFAVQEELRGRGTGGRILDAVTGMYPGCRVIADAERPLPGTQNEALRKRRIGFYARCGFEETDVKYNWRGEEYVILSRGGNVTEAEFDAFWEHIEKKDARFGSY